MRISLKWKLFFLVLLPHVAIIGLAIEAVSEKWMKRTTLESLLPITEIATASSALIHELQIERGQTVGLISSDHAEANQISLNLQRSGSDQVLSRDHAVPAIDRVIDVAVGDDALRAKRRSSEG